ncbi:hypothetical protein B0H14DRAFT_3513061 [Mycena olivaceomarginata]|nr:hypothetical protein B0H14DRAFT_3513061 [Mycena olivaceomarginata]
MWIDGGRGGFEGTNDASLTRIHVDRFPFNEPRDLKHSYTIAVASQDQHGMFVYPQNHLVRDLEPGLLEPWRGNILVFKHGSTASKAIVNITDEDVALVEAILKRVLRDGLIEYSFLSVMMQTRAVRKLCSENYRDIFFATADLRRRTLLYLPLIPLLKYGQASRFTRGEVMSLARACIEFYTALFFPTSQLVTLFFHELEDRRAWIVGSVALAALSFSCDLVVPNNLNVITSALTEDTWITFFRDHFGYKLRSVPCGSFYVKLARSRLIFMHDNIEHKTITITVSRNVEIFELFLRARTAPDSPWMPALAEGIRNMPFPAVECLALVVCDNRHRRLGRRRPRAVVNQPMFGAFSAAHFCPYMLRLERFGFCWTDTPKVDNLSTLMLQFLGTEAGLTVHELRLVFENATALKCLSIHMIRVAGSYLLSNNVPMNSLKFLEYKPGGDGTLGLLMANLDAPALFELHLLLGEGDRASMRSSV